MCVTYATVPPVDYRTVIRALGALPARTHGIRRTAPATTAQAAAIAWSRPLSRAHDPPRRRSFDAPSTPPGRAAAQAGVIRVTICNRRVAATGPPRPFNACILPRPNADPMTDSTYAAANIRASVRAFAIGRALTAPASFLLVFLLASFMPSGEYAAYVAATAALEICLALGTCGLDWLTQSVVPGVRVNGTATQLRRTVARLLTMQVLPYLLLGTLFAVFAPRLAQLLSGVVPAGVLRWYGLILAVEGMARMLRDQVLGALLMQRVVQVLQIQRIVLMLAAIVAMRWGGVVVTAQHIAYVELASSLATLVVGGYALTRYLAGVHGKPGEAADIRPWFGRQSFRFVLNAYGSFLLTISIGPEVVTTIIARMLGAEATAQFGFAARVIDQLRRVLPMDLLWVIIRPALVGRFEQSGRSFRRLSDDVTLILRANLLLLGGAMVLLAGAGQSAVAAATHGNMLLPQFLLAAMLAQVLGHSLRRALELICFLIGRAHLFLYGSFAALLVPLLLTALLAQRPDIYFVPLAMFIAEMIFSGIVYSALLRDGREMKVSALNGLKLALCSAVGAVATHAMSRWIPGVAGLVAGAAAGGLLYLLLLVPAGLIGRADLELVRGLLRSRLRRGEAAASATD